MASNSESDFVAMVYEYLDIWSYDQPNSGFINGLINTLQPFEEDIKFAVAKVKADFQQVVSSSTYHFDLQPFGSSVTGLALRGNDLL